MDKWCWAGEGKHGATWAPHMSVIRTWSTEAVAAVATAGAAGAAAGAAVVVAAAAGAAAAADVAAGVAKSVVSGR